MTAEVLIDFVAKDDFSGVLGNFGNIMTGIKSTIDLVAGAFDAVVGAVTPFIQSAMDSENAIANLDATLKSTGGAAGLTSQQLQDMANAFQSVTKFSDETIINGEAMLLTFTNIGKDVFPLATEAMLNLAEKFGSVDSAAVQLGKALNDPISGITALQRVGVSFTDEQKDMIKTLVEAGDVVGAQKIILAELEKEFGGLAVAMGDTFQGQWTIFKNNLDNIREIIGGALLPVLGDLLSKFNDFVTSPEVIQFFKDLGQAIADMATGDLSGIDTLFGNLFQKMADAVNNWVTGGGAEALSNDLISWIENIGTSPDTQSKALTAAGNLLKAIANALAAVDWSAVATAMDNQMATVITAHDWKSSGDAFGVALLGIFDSASQTAGAEMSNPASSTTTALKNAISQWLLGAMNATSWSEIGDRFYTLFKIGVIEALLAQPLVINGIKIALGAIQFVTNLYTIGANIVNGIIQGIEDTIGLITVQMVIGMVNMYAAVKGFLGIHSPSSLFAGIGVNIIDGLVQGLDSKFDGVIDWFKNLIDKIEDLNGWDIIAGIVNPGGSSGGTTGSHDTGTTTTPGGGVVTGGTVTNNYYFYGTTYLNQVGPEGTYECVPSPIITDTATINPGGGTIGNHTV